MKKRLILFLAVCLLTVCSSAWADYWDEGYNGLTEATAYRINTLADLTALRDRVNNGTEPSDRYYKLTQSITANALWYSSQAIGAYEAKPFTGHFNGNGNTISVSTGAPVFGVIDSDGTAVKYLNVKGNVHYYATYDESNAGNEIIGGIAGRLKSGTIENCNFDGKSVMNGRNGDYDRFTAGGIVGMINSGGKVINCRVSCDVYAGLLYSHENYCGYAGGIAGILEGGTIEKCRVTINDSIYAFSGGSGGSDVQNSHAGGVVGYVSGESSKIDNCVVKGVVRSKQYAGGIVGYMQAGSLKNCYVLGDSAVEGNYIAGGIAGYIGGDAVVQNTMIEMESQVSAGSEAVGGIVGHLNSGTVKSDKAYTLVKGRAQYKGAIIGKATGSPNVVSGNYYSTSIGVENVIGYDNSILGPSKTGGQSHSDEKSTVIDPVDYDPLNPSPYKPNNPAPTITTTSLANGVRGKSYSVTLKSDRSGVKWSKKSGTLPTGLKLTSAGKLSGTPTEAGNFTFTVKATANGSSTTKKFTVKVTQTTVTATIPAEILTGTSYTWTPKATGGTSAYKWSKSSGTLPTGMKINASTGKITGKPTKAGTFKFTIKAVDKNKIAGTKAFTVKVIAAKVDLESAISNIAIKGSAFSGYVLASNGTAPYTWSISSGKLPTGLKLTSSSTKATIKGTPTKTGTFTFTVKAVDKNKASATVKITVLVIDISSLAGTAGKSAQTAEPSSSKTTEQKSSSSKSSLQTAPLDLSTGSNTDVNIRATLSVASDDVVESYEGKDSDMVKVKADKPLTFIIGKWPEEVESVTVYVDDKAVDGVKVTEGVFTLPPELVHNDFKVSVKSGKQESEELFIIAE